MSINKTAIDSIVNSNLSNNSPKPNNYISTPTSSNLTSFPISNPITLHHTQSTATSSNNISNDPTSSTIQNLITFTTINTKGLNNFAKLQALANHTSDRTILFCTETKLKQEDRFPRNINGRSIIYGNSSSSAKNGTALIIGRSLTSHIHKIISHSEYCSSILLKFKGKVNILISAIYLLHDKTERKAATKQVIQMVKTAASNKFHHAILGDFNTYPKNSPSINAPTTSIKQTLYRNLHNYIDIGHQLDEKAFTFITPTSAL
jgi:hypothetical protein